MDITSIDQVDVAIVVKKQSGTGIFKNQRLLLIKAGYLSYYSKKPKTYVGNVRSIQLSGELPKMTLSATNVESIQRKGKYLHIKFNKKHLIDNSKLSGLISGEIKESEIQQENQSQGDIQWVFKCEDIERAQIFMNQVQICRNNPAIKPQMSKIILGYKQGKKGFRPQSLYLQPHKKDRASTTIFSIGSNAHRLSEQLGLATNKYRITNEYDDKPKKGQIKFMENGMVLPKEEDKVILEEEQEHIEEEKEQKENNIQNDIEKQKINQNQERNENKKQQIEDREVINQNQQTSQNIQSPKIVQKTNDKQQHSSSNKNIDNKQKSNKSLSFKLKKAESSITQRSVSSKLSYRSSKNGSISPHDGRKKNKKKVQAYSKETFPYFPFVINKMDQDKDAKLKEQLQNLGQPDYQLIKRLTNNSNRKLSSQQPQEKQKKSQKNILKRYSKQQPRVHQISIQNQIDRKSSSTVANTAWSKLKNKERNMSVQNQSQSVSQNRVEQELQGQIEEELKMEEGQNKCQQAKVGEQLFQEDKASPYQQINQQYHEQQGIENQNVDKKNEYKIIHEKSNQSQNPIISQIDVQEKNNQQGLVNQEQKESEDRKVEMIEENENKQVLDEGNNEQQEDIKYGQTQNNGLNIDQQNCEQQIQNIIQIENQQVCNKMNTEYSDKSQANKQIQQVNKTSNISQNGDNKTINNTEQNGSNISKQDQNNGQKEMKVQENLNIEQQLNKQQQLKQKQEDIQYNSGTDNIQTNTQIKQQGQKLEQLKSFKEEQKLNQSNQQPNDNQIINDNNSANYNTNYQANYSANQITEANEVGDIINCCNDMGIVNSANSNDDNISFSNLKLSFQSNDEGQKSNGPSTPRFWDEDEQQGSKDTQIIYQTKDISEQLQSSVMSLDSRQENLQTSIDTNIRNEEIQFNKRQNQRIQQKQIQSKRKLKQVAQKKETKKQALLYTQQLLNSSKNKQRKGRNIKNMNVGQDNYNEVKSVLRKIMNHRLQKQKIAKKFSRNRKDSSILPMPIATELLNIRKNNEIKRMAMEAMSQLISNDNKNDGGINCENILLGARMKLPGFCLYLYEDKQKYNTVRQFYNQLNLLLSEPQFSNKIQLPQIFYLTYQQQHAILLQSIKQNMEQAQCPIKQILNSIIQQNIEEIKEHSVVYYDERVNKNVVWTDPDYIKYLKLKNNESVKEQTPKSYQEIKFGIQQQWKQLIQEKQRQQIKDIKKCIDKIRQYEEKYKLSIKINDTKEDRLEIISTFHIQQLSPLKNMTIIDKVHANISSNLKKLQIQKAADAVYWYGLKLLAESEIQPIHIRKYINAFIKTAQLYFYEQKYTQVRDICSYVLQTVFGKQFSKRIIQGKNQVQISDMISHIRYYCCLTEQICILLALLLIYKIKSSNSYTYIRNLYKNILAIIQNMVSIFSFTNKVNQIYSEMMINAMYYSYLVQNFPSPQIQIIDQMLKIKKKLYECALQIISNWNMDKKDYNRETLDGQFLMQCVLGYAECLMQGRRYVEAEVILKQGIQKNISNNSYLISSLKCCFDICLLHTSSLEILPLNHHNFIAYLEYFLQNFPQESNKFFTQVSLISTIISTYCEFYAYNDYQLCTSLMTTVHKYNILPQTKSKILEEGLEKLEPALRKRMKNKYSI